MLMTYKDELVKYDKPLSLVLGGEPINFEVVNELRNNAFIKILINMDLLNVPLVARPRP